jgi:hypothetical protein
MRIITSAAGTAAPGFSALASGQHGEEFSSKPKRLPPTLQKDATVEANLHLVLPPRIRPFMRGREHLC